MSTAWPHRQRAWCSRHAAIAARSPATAACAAGEDLQLAAVALVGDVVDGVAAADPGQELALARVALAHDLAQLVGAQSPGQRCQPAARRHARKLTGVADRDHLDPGQPGVLEDERGLARARHPRLVDDQHGAAKAEAGVVGTEVKRHARERPSVGDARQAGCRHARGRCLSRPTPEKR
jgi:hypothetical protein